jgi:hypothetical protein
MQRDRDITASERLVAVAELLARGIDRLIMHKHDRDKTGGENKKCQVQQRECL